MSQQELGSGGGEAQEEAKGPGDDKERLKKRKNQISNDAQELQKTLGGIPQDQEGSRDISLNKPPMKNSGMALNLQEGVIKGPKSKVDSGSKKADKESDSVISKSSSGMYLKTSPTVTLKMEPGLVART